MYFTHIYSFHHSYSTFFFFSNFPKTVRIFRISSPGSVLCLIFEPSLTPFPIHLVRPRKLVFTPYHFLNMLLAFLLACLCSYWSVSHELDIRFIFLLILSRDPFPHLWLSQLPRSLTDHPKCQVIFSLKTLPGIAVLAQCSPQCPAQVSFSFYRRLSQGSGRFNDLCTTELICSSLGCQHHAVLGHSAAF